MDVETIPNLIAEQRDQAPDELQHYFIQFEDFWERKLWHELTNVLIEYFDHKDSAPQRIPLYETFIKRFAGKINQLKLVTLGLKTASQYKGKTHGIYKGWHNVLTSKITEKRERLSFLTALADGVNKPVSQDAFVYATVAVADIQLQLQEYEASRRRLDECEKILDSFDSVETVVHASFYRVNAEYCKVRLSSTLFSYAFIC